MSPLKQDAANPLILFIFSGFSYWFDRWRGGSDGGIERRRWRWQGVGLGHWGW
jgi:hypothetical protein